MVAQFFRQEFQDAHTCNPGRNRLSGSNRAVAGALYGATGTEDPVKASALPEEGHWILKPQDSQFWYATVIDWLTQYSKKLSSDSKIGPGN
jgi:hypothetical protein